MAYSLVCASQCGDVTLVPTPASCTIRERFTSPGRLIYIPCDAELPTPIKGSIAPLFEDGTIVYSSELGNWEFSEPEFVDSAISACRPANRIIASRTITMQDRIAISTESGSPVVTDDYADYAPIKDKLLKQGNWYAGIWYCNGDVFLPKRENGQLIPATFSAYIGYEVLNAASNLTVEVKYLSLTYQGDPLYFNAPDFNTFEEGITL